MKQSPTGQDEGADGEIIIPDLTGRPEVEIRAAAERIGQEAGRRVREALGQQEFQIGSQDFAIRCSARSYSSSASQAWNY